MPIDKQTFEALPESVRAEFVQDGDGYIHSDTIGRREAEGKAEFMKKSNNELDAKVKKIEREEAARVDAAKKAAFDEAYAKAAPELRAQLDSVKNDYETRLTVREQELADRKSRERKSSLDAVHSELGGLFPEHVRGVASIALKNILDYSADDGVYSILSGDGSASPIDRAAIADAIKKHPAFESLIGAEVHTHGGGHTKSSSGGSATTQKNSTDLIRAGLTAL